MPYLRALAFDQVGSETKIMAIVYDPKKLLAEVAPDAKIKRLVSKRLDFKKAALSFFSDVPFIDESKVKDVTLKTIKDYKNRVALEKAEESAAGRELESELSKSPMQLIQRVQNEVVWQISQNIRKSYEGEKYEWLPSDADEPDPEHQLNYGKVFVVGEGEMPGDRIGCKCGMRILVTETELALD